jgi:hypothetical protein
VKKLIRAVKRLSHSAFMMQTCPKQMDNNQRKK